MHTFLLILLLTAFVGPSLSTAIGSLILRNALHASHSTPIFGSKVSSPLVLSSRQSTTFENIPICTSVEAERALAAYRDCDGCVDQLLQLDSDVDPDTVSDTCPNRCCGDYSLNAAQTRHFIQCLDGCCRRLVELQAPDDASSEEAELASRLNIVVNNEYQVTGVGDLNRCELAESPAENRKCGRRCAYLFKDPERCQGRTTVDVPVFGQAMDSSNPPCSPAESQNPNDDDGAAATASPVDSQGDDDSDDDSSSDVCVDALLLRLFRQDDLAFRKHRVAHVICDNNRSCATPGHVVVFHGRSMMMRSYCDLVGCSKQVLHVNSPRFGLRLRIPSRTEGLHFTAFAARYQTRVEEFLLSRAIHIGL